MRGVDVGTKREVYAMIRAEAERGRTFLWYTTEMDELRTATTSTSSATGGSWPTSLATRLTEEAVLHASFRASRRESAPSLDALGVPHLARSMLPALSLAVLLAAIFWLQPRTMSYFGLNLMLNLAIPIALATIAQMFVITVNDLDLSHRHLCRLRRLRRRHLAASRRRCSARFARAAVGVYAALGALIQLRSLPSIVVTLGMSFVWLGLAVLVLPTPGGKAPDWVRADDA